MAKAKTSSFITEIPLVVDSFLERKLEARFQAARQLYNTCLNEVLRRLGRVKKSTSYLAAKELSRNKKKERKELFKQARDDAQFSEYSLHSFATATAKQSKWIAKNVDSNTQQKLATRAFQAVEKILFGTSSKVRFKVPSRFRSVEGKSNKQGIRWKEEQVQWCGLTVLAIIDWNNPVVVHGLHSKVKYCRLLWRNLNGKKRWFVQLVNEGTPYEKPQNYVTKGVVGLDINVSNVAFVADEQAGLLPFALEVPTYEREVKALQRRMQRSMRTNNPDNFEPDSDRKVGNRVVRKKGKVLKGKRQWKRSKNYRILALQKAEFERRKASYAKCQNRRLVNEILRHGNEIKTEKVSIKGWQNRYGKAIAAKSPGFFQSEIKRKAAKCATGSIPVVTFAKMLAVVFSSFLLRQQHCHKPTLTGLE